MRDILLQILAAIKDLAPVGSVAADPNNRQTVAQDEPKQEETKEETKEEVVETKSTRRATK